MTSALETTLILDIGNQNTVAYYYGENIRNFTIIQSPGSQRFFPTKVGYYDKKAYFGEAAEMQETIDPTTVTGNIKTLLGIEYNDNSSSKLPKYNVELIENKDLHEYAIKYGSQEVSIVQALATQISGIIRQVEVKLKGCIIIVPPFYADKERRRMINAAQVAGFPCEKISLLNSNIAQSVLYLIRVVHPSKLEKFSAVLVDSGDTSIELTKAVYTRKSYNAEKNGKTVKRYTYDIALSDVHEVQSGGSKITDIFVEFLFKRISPEQQNEFRKPKNMLRFRAAAEKAKKQLKLGTDVTFECRGELPKNDVKFIFKPEDFNEYDEIKREINFIEDELQIPPGFKIEASGGGSRFVPLEKLFNKMAGKDSKTVESKLDMESCFCEGAAFWYARSMNTYLRETSIKNVHTYSVLCISEDELFQDFIITKNTNSQMRGARIIKPTCFPYKIEFYQSYEEGLEVTKTNGAKISRTSETNQKSTGKRQTEDRTFKFPIASLTIQELPSPFVEFAPVVCIDSNGLFQLEMVLGFKPESEKYNSETLDPSCYKYESLSEISEGTIRRYRRKQEEYENLEKSDKERDNLQYIYETKVYDLKRGLTEPKGQYLPYLSRSELKKLSKVRDKHLEKLNDLKNPSKNVDIDYLKNSLESSLETFMERYSRFTELQREMNEIKAKIKRSINSKNKNNFEIRDKELALLDEAASTASDNLNNLNKQEAFYDDYTKYVLTPLKKLAKSLEVDIKH